MTLVPIMKVCSSFLARCLLHRYQVLFSAYLCASWSFWVVASMLTRVSQATERNIHAQNYTHIHFSSDNIACPMASSLGDIVTLVILATFARLLEEHMSKLIKTISIFENSRRLGHSAYYAFIYRLSFKYRPCHRNGRIVTWSGCFGLDKPVCEGTLILWLDSYHECHGDFQVGCCSIIIS